MVARMIQRLAAPAVVPLGTRPKAWLGHCPQRRQRDLDLARVVLGYGRRQAARSLSLRRRTPRRAPPVTNEVSIADRVDDSADTRWRVDRESTNLPIYRAICRHFPR